MDEVVIVEDPCSTPTGSGWGPIIFFIIVILIIFILIGFFIWEHSNRVGDLELGKSCSAGPNECRPGLFCDRGLCREPIGGECNDISDCVSTATACFNKMCTNVKLSDIGGKPPCLQGLINDHGICRLIVGGICRKDNECVRGSYCSHDRCKKYSDFPDSSSSSNSSSSSSSSESSSDEVSKSSSKSSRSPRSARSSSSTSSTPSVPESKSSDNQSVYQSQSESRHPQRSHHSSIQSPNSSSIQVPSDSSNISNSIQIPSGNHSDDPEETFASLYSKLKKKRVYNFDI